ncbi:MAG: response regulator transcription factor [Clostridia bacterium]|nr:response regulator transcription factor [Clostridia bacterium]
MIKILLVEDDEKLNESICHYLSSNGFQTTGCLSALSALGKMNETKFNLIISDIMMPNMDGFDFAKSVRLFDKIIPILFITARDDLSSKEKGYSIGIDDYLVKPFELTELKLRIGALLRRAKIEASKSIEIGNFVMNEEEHSATLNGQEISFTVKEFSLLYKLLSFPKKTFSRSKLMEEFWGFDSSATSRAVDVCIAEIRKKIQDCESFEIVTVHGLGYKVVLK